MDENTLKIVVKTKNLKCILTNIDAPLYEQLGLRKMDAEYIWHHIRWVRKHQTENQVLRISDLFERFNDEMLVYALIVYGKIEKDESWSG